MNDEWSNEDRNSYAEYLLFRALLLLDFDSSRVEAALTKVLEQAAGAMTPENVS